MSYDVFIAQRSDVATGGKRKASLPAARVEDSDDEVRPAFPAYETTTQLTNADVLSQEGDVGSIKKMRISKGGDEESDEASDDDDEMGEGEERPAKVYVTTGSKKPLPEASRPKASPGRLVLKPKKPEGVKAEPRVVHPAQPQFVGKDLSTMQDHSRDAQTKIKKLHGLLASHSAVSDPAVVELLHEVKDVYCVLDRKVGDVQPAIKTLLDKVEAGGVISDGSVSGKVAELNDRLKKLLEKLSANETELARLEDELKNAPEDESDPDYDELKNNVKQARERRDGTLVWIKKIKKDIEAADSSKIKPDDVEALRTALDGLHSYYETVVDGILIEDEHREAMRIMLAKLTAKAVP